MSNEKDYVSPDARKVFDKYERAIASQSKHTPGPWEMDSGMVQTAYIHKDCKLTVGFCDVHTPIAYMDRKPNNGTMPTERDANARLIAAAPELLEALRAIIYPNNERTVEFNSNQQYYLAKIEGGELERAIQAIAKAESKQ